MRLSKLLERRVAADAACESLQPLCAREIREVAGALYYETDQTAPEPLPTWYPDPPPPDALPRPA